MFIVTEKAKLCNKHEYSYQTTELKQKKFTVSMQQFKSNNHDNNIYIKFRFPLKDVSILVTLQKTQVNFPLYKDNWNQINQTEFALEVEGVAWFYAKNGNYIEVCPYENYNQHTVELYLNGSVYGAILHQRSILPLHGSSFNYLGNGILVCGESGVGKSSITASFSLNGAAFLTDDITPVLFTDNKPRIWAMSDRIKLWADSLEQLKQEKKGLHQIDAETEKFFFPMIHDKGETHSLHQVFLLAIHDHLEVKFQEITGIEKFTALRNEIYRSEYLLGMQESEPAYFNQIACLSKDISVIKVLRPKNITIAEFHFCLQEFIVQNKSKPATV